MSYALNTLVSKEEQAALKEMIFKRAQERAESLNKEMQDTYTTSVQNDIMFSARDSFVAKKNPFSFKDPNKEEDNVNNYSAKEKIAKAAKEHAEEIKSQIYNKNNQTRSSVAETTIASTMEDARNDFERKNTFMGALNFLNSQASISLIRNRGSNFEALV